MEHINDIKEAGLKLTPQRRMVYEAIAELHHAGTEDIIAAVRKKDEGITVSTIYRILDSFCEAGLVSIVCHPATGKCYYDINAREHHHLFEGGTIMDYTDPELSKIIREYLLKNNFDAKDIERVQVQITLSNNNNNNN